LKTLIISAETDARKFYERGNNTAGVRLRKSLLLSKTIAQDIRKDVSTKKNA
ncbi:MAG: histone H1, partial [Chryseobacterium sp.]